MILNVYHPTNPVIACDYFASGIPQHYFNLEQCVARCLRVICHCLLASLEESLLCTD